MVLLEAETIGWGASGWNGGQVNPGLKDGPSALAGRFGVDLGGRMARLSGAGCDPVFDLIERHAIRCDARRLEWIRAAHTPKALASLKPMLPNGAPLVPLRWVSLRPRSISSSRATRSSG
jgi:glycine/D-amino acid oxidase-like deaminating enzyme